MKLKKCPFCGSELEYDHPDCIHPVGKPEYNEETDELYYPLWQISTCMYFQPVYDKHGNNINPDRNTTSGEMFCSVCKRKWRYVKRLSEYSYEEVAQDLTSSVESGTIDSVEVDEGC